MVKKYFTSTLWLLLFCISTLNAANAHANGIKWITNYEEAIDLGKSSSKPVILFFTGSDWCGWCNKLEEEVFDTQEFASLAGNKYVFLKLDFPLYAPQPQQLSAQNKQLQKKFNITSYPTIVIFDAQTQQQIGTTGYRPGGSLQYSQHLQKLIDSYKGYKEKLSTIPTQKLSGYDLKKLYEKSKEFDLSNDTTYIMRYGIESDAKPFFLTEKYRFLAEEGQIHQAEAVALKKQLLSMDPENNKLAHYNIAVIEFEALSEQANNDAIAPLLNYIEKFGNKDKENLWRLEMIISQVYLDKNQLQEALKHAQASHDAAPTAVQQEIASAIKSIQTQISTNK